MTPAYVLTYGKHATREQGMCLLEAVAYIAGEPHNDTPECACGVLAAYGRSLNDVMGEGPEGDALRDRYLGDIAPLLVGTRSTPEVERRRAYLLADRAVRVIAPMALEAVDLHDHAATLRALAPVTDAATARAAYAAATVGCAAARAAAYAAARAARAAGAAAAYAAGAAAAYAAGAAADAVDSAARANARVAMPDSAADAARAAADAARAARVADPDTVWAEARQALIDAIQISGGDA
jgi:hypothetical protein